MARPIVARTGRRIALGRGALARPPAAGVAGVVAATGAESVRFATVLLDLGARGVDATVVALLAAAVAARSPLRVRILSVIFLGL